MFVERGVAVEILLVFLICLIAATPGWTNSPEPEPEPEAAAFDIWEYRVDGNSKLDNRAIERALYDHLGPEKNFAQVNDARAALEGAYRDAGYATVTVSVPEQTVRNGIVRLEVTEARLGRVKISGAKYFANSDLRAQIQSLASGEVPNFNEVQAELGRLAKRSSDRNITPLLRAGRVPGSVEVELAVDDRLPFHGSIELNNYRSANTTDLRLSGSLSYNNLWQKQHSLSLQYQVSPEDLDEVKALSASYLLRPQRNEDIYAFYVVDTDSAVSTLGDISVLGSGTIAGVRGIYPVLQNQRYSASIVVGADYKNFDEVLGLSATEEAQTGIEYFTFTAGANGLLFHENGTTSLGLTATSGVRGLGNNRQEFENKRFKAEPNFLYLNADVQHQRRLSSYGSLVARVNTQISRDTLIGNEQFGLGGQASARGYLEAEELADTGINASFELRSPDLWQAFGLPERGSLQAFLFYDWVHGRNHEVLPGEPQRSTLASAGLGLDLENWFGVDATVNWAHALKGSRETERGDDQIAFMVRYGF